MNAVRNAHKQTQSATCYNVHESVSRLEKQTFKLPTEQRRRRYRVLILLVFGWAFYAQYPPPTPTRLNYWVESRRRCVLNSQLVHDGFGRKIKNWKVEFAAELETSSRVDCRRVSTHRPTQLNSTQHVRFSFFYQNRRQSSWTILCEFSTPRDADATQLDTGVASASAMCIGLLTRVAER